MAVQDQAIRKYTIRARIGKTTEDSKCRPLMSTVQGKRRVHRSPGYELMQ